MSATAAITMAGNVIGMPGTNAGEGPPAVRDTIERFLDTRNEAVVTQQGADVAVSIASFDVPLTDSFAATTAHALTELESMRQTLSGLGERYTAAATSVALLDSARSGDVVRVEVAEHTALTYERIRGDEPVLTAYTLRHTIELILDSGTWRIAADLIDRTGLMPVTVARSSGDPIYDEPPAQPAVDTSDSVAIATLQYSSAYDCGVVNGCDPTDAVSAATKFAPALQSPTGALVPADVPKVDTVVGVPDLGPDRAGPPPGMNYRAIIDYAYRYYDNYNGSYRTFAPKDCTNFLSQAMRAGGWKDDPGWYRSSNNWWYSSYNQTFSWAGAENWSRFAPRRTASYQYTNQVMPSDVMQIDFGKDNNMNHSMIVVKKSGGVPYFAYHSTDSVDVSLTYLEQRYPHSSNWWYAYRT